jgi:hypothetical protein
LYIAIQCAGDQKNLSFTRLFIVGLSESLSLKKDSWSIILKLNGYQSLLNIKDSKNGLRMLMTGASQETDTGATLYQFGFQMTMKKLLLLVL